MNVLQTAKRLHLLTIVSKTDACVQASKHTDGRAALSGSRNPEPFGCFAVPVFNMLESR